MYAGALGLSVDINERRLALTRAREHDLYMERVAIVTAERTIDDAFRVSHDEIFNVLFVMLK